MSRYLLIVAVFVLSSCGVMHWPESVETSFEEFTRKGDSLWVSVGNQHIFSNGQIDSSAIDGIYSLMVRERDQVALEYVHKDPEPDSKYLLTVWRKTTGRNNRGALVALVDEPGGLREVRRADNPAETQAGWEKLELLVQLPPDHEASAIHFRLVNFGDDPVWFDHFKLEFLEKVYYPDYPEIETMQIRISEPDLERLREKRLQAFTDGYIDMEKEDWIRAEVQFGDTVRTGNLTLKGDQLYNLEGDKWSMKIELDEETLMGMRYFSVHNPEMRSFLDEWLFHAVLEDEEIVCSRYGFVPLTLNGRSLGVYAYEERIVDETFVHRDTVNAIARFQDLGWVKTQQMLEEQSISKVEDPFEKADIQIFRKVEFDKELRDLFKEQIKDFRNVEPDMAAAFDIQKTARMLALCDLMEAYHSLHWTNIRLISNADTKLMELVGNDGYTTDGPGEFREGPFMAWSDHPVVYESVRWKAMYLNLFNDPDFVAAYLDALDRLTRKQYLDVVKLNTFGAMKYYQNIMMEEWPAYRFNFSRFYERARTIQKHLEAYQELQESQSIRYEYTAPNVN